jgi:spore maturation protein SpmA
MPELEEATTQELFEEIAKRHSAAVLGVMTRNSNSRVMYAGNVATCLGMLELMRGDLLDSLTTRETDDVSDEEL